MQIVQAVKALDGLILDLPDVRRTEQEQLEAVAVVQARTRLEAAQTRVCAHALALAQSVELLVDFAFQEGLLSQLQGATSMLLLTRYGGYHFSTQLIACAAQQVGSCCGSRTGTYVK